MATVTDPKIAEAYENVRSNSDETTWMILDYESDKSDTLTLTSTGTGNLEEFASKLEPGHASFGYIRVTYKNDDHSSREKFCLVIWIGEQVKVMRRAKVSVHTADVKRVLKAYSIEVSASTKGDLQEKDIVSRLRKAGGANYNRSDFD
ncbi:hypothetical protein BD324DRAFT_678818 [Kockovaella imperatae]|uniref:ADF-H domain-containing protein n=1 Tax=Kockovaella imperatae TaxID=4999 RepID=A0A1Y1UNV3_9TREE|nr:hypothetical protein BD324DRAFT_678818 [Kockovaella imperatae]ORX39713.1 hypothetical protein BD324DRAFT_678818 [Kockovaella imperatae]